MMATRIKQRSEFFLETRPIVSIIIIEYISYGNNCHESNEKVRLRAIFSGQKILEIAMGSMKP